MPSPAQVDAGSARHFRSSVWVLITGLLLGLSFPPTGFYPLGWFALVPLIVRWAESRSGWETFCEAFAAFLTMSVVAGYWTLLHHEVPQSLRSGALLLMLPLLLAMPFLAGFQIRHHLGLLPGFATLVAASLLMEHVLAQYFVPLPWLQLGHTQLESLSLIQVADLSGVSTLSLWVWLLGGLGAWTLRAPSFLKPVFANRAVALLSLGLVFALPFLYGSQSLERTQTHARAVEVGLVQPAVSPQQWLYSDPAARIDHLARLSEELLDDLAEDPEAAPLDLVIWPELALPAYADVERTERLHARVAGWTQQHGVTLLTGAVTQPIALPGGPRSPRYNSALLFSSDVGRTTDVHLQRSDQTTAHLAFDGARYIEPQLEDFQGLDQWEIKQVEYDFERGAAKSLMSTAQGTLVPLIGFESLYAEQARRHAVRGADLLVVLAQNDWWGRLPSSHLHYAMARLLAVETRLPVVVSTVNGVSGFVLGSGRGVENAAKARASSSHTVYLSAKPSPYLRHGNLVVRGSMVLLFLVGFGFAMRTAADQIRPEPPPPLPDFDDDEPASSYKPRGLSWPTATAYEDEEGSSGLFAGEVVAGDGALSAAPPPADAPDFPGDYDGNLAVPEPVPQAPLPSPAAPWSTSPSPSSSPPDPPDDAISSAPWASPSRFASPVTPKSSPPSSPPTEP